MQTNELKNAILAAQDIEALDVEVEKWGGLKIRFVGMNGTARNHFRRAVAMMPGDNATALGLAVLEKAPEFLIDTMVNPENGERIFTMEELPLLLGKNGQVLEELTSVWLEFQKLSDTAMEDDQKDFSGTAKSDSGTPSPGTSESQTSPSSDAA